SFFFCLYLFFSFASRSSRLFSSTLFPYTTLFRSIVDSDLIIFIFVQIFLQIWTPFIIYTVCPRDYFSDIRLFVRHFFFHYRNNKDRKSTRLNSSHSSISYAVFCLKKKSMNF